MCTCTCTCMYMCTCTCISKCTFQGSVCSKIEDMSHIQLKLLWGHLNKQHILLHLLLLQVVDYYFGLHRHGKHPNYLYISSTDEEAFLENLDGQSSRATNWYELADPKEQPLEMMQVIMMRKDPPFDMEYIYSTYYLERAEAKGTLVINKPSSLRDCNEKLFATHFPELTPELVVSRNSQTLKEFFMSIVALTKQGRISAW